MVRPVEGYDFHGLTLTFCLLVKIKYNIDIKPLEVIMNILVTIDQNYIKQLEVMMFSLRRHHPKEELDVYLLHEKIPEKALKKLSETLQIATINLHPIQIDNQFFENFPITERYPYTMYYRLLAAHFLPDSVDRVLYLDPDLVIINPIDELYNIQFNGQFFAAATHVEKTLEKINQVRLNYSNGIYVNSGVLLMNINLLRAEQDVDAIAHYVERFKDLLFLPDQDVLSALYPDKIIKIEASQYNMTERMWIKEKVNQLGGKLEWIDENCHIIHYIGKNKPWLPNYFGELDRYYIEAEGYLKGRLDAAKSSQ